MDHRALFHPRLLRETLAKHRFPVDIHDRRERLRPWLLHLEAGELERTKETKLDVRFLESMFGQALGYRLRMGEQGAAWDLDVQENVLSIGSRPVDGAIGWFGIGTSPKVHAVIELKGAGQPLDHAGGRVVTPVQQAWEYAYHVRECRWIIVSNFKETRLYSKASTPDSYEVFFLRDMLEGDAFHRLYLLLSRESLLPSGPGRSLTDDLLEASDRVEAEITSALYADYGLLRRELFEDLRRAHSNLPPLDVLGHTQKLLDRVLFLAFAEDRGLLPPKTIEQALTHQDYYAHRPVWQNLLTLFRWVDKGNPKTNFHAYNGGLFAPDEELEALDPSDKTCQRLSMLAKYDFRDDVSVDVLGHIFEQSITDLESLQAEIKGEEPPALSRRKTEGVFYTPSFVTRYIVEETLGRVFKERFEEAMARHHPDTPSKGLKPDQAWFALWTDYRESLKNLRVLDLSCGSGAFLVAAFDALHAEYTRVTAELASLRGGQTQIWDLNKAILNNNLFGVDLSPESIEITRLSLWLRTAVPGNPLTWLDGNIRCGNSIVSDVFLCGAAFDWSKGRQVDSWLDPGEAPQAAEVDSRWHEGFDVVLGNPPYVRQELLTGIKDHLRKNYATFHGMADLYVYFFERGFTQLKAGGRLGFVVANKWLKGGYAEPLRAWLAREAELETLVDFGHAPIFPDADAFPSIVTLKKPQAGVPPEMASSIGVTRFPREQLGTTSVREYVAAKRYSFPRAHLGGEAWTLEPPGVEDLMRKMREVGVPLRGYVGVKPYRGVLTGFNDAFLIDGAARSRLIREDARSAELIHKYLRGQDVERWAPDWDGQHIIALVSSGDRAWPWSGLPEEKAEEAFRRELPALYDHFKPNEPALRKRKDHGRYWWELRSCAYYNAFEKPKIFYPDITWTSSFCFDTEGRFTNNTVYFLPSSDPWLVTVLNAPLMWAFLWRNAVHGKDEALRLFCDFMETLPIAPPSEKAGAVAEDLVPRLVAHARANHESRRGLLDVLRMEHGVEKAGNALSGFHRLDADAFVAEIVNRRPKKAPRLSPAGLRALRELHESETLPLLARLQEMSRWERCLSDLVNAAYGLTEDEIDLVRKTAPPRMPSEI